MTIDDIHGTAKCQMCGQPATAFWDGMIGRIEVCAACATTKLVQMIVDAHPRLDLTTADMALERIMTAFYRGVAARWAREGKAPEGDDCAA